MANSTAQSVFDKIPKIEELRAITLELKQHFQEIKESQRTATEFIDSMIVKLDYVETATSDVDEHLEKVTKLKDHAVKFLQSNVIEVTAIINSMMTPKQNKIGMEFRKHDNTMLDQTLNESFAKLNVASKIEEFDLTDAVNLQPFISVKLTSHVSKFLCKIIGVIDTLHLIVEPIIDKFIDEFNDMEDEIKHYGHKLNPIDDESCTMNQACIARYSEDSRYYRALIRDPNNSEDEVKVLFVDYLNLDIVKRKYVKPYPHELLQKPLKHLIVKLHGVNPNPRVRESDITLHLNDYVDKEAIVAIIQNGSIPAVHLYDKNNQKVLIYQSLIGLDFFHKYPDTKQKFTEM